MAKVLKGQKLPRKKAPVVRRKLSGAKGAPMDDYKQCRNYFHFEVENKEYVSIVKAYVKKNFDKKNCTEYSQKQRLQFCQKPCSSLLSLDV